MIFLRWADIDVAKIIFTAGTKSIFAAFFLNVKKLWTKQQQDKTQLLVLRRIVYLLNGNSHVSQNPVIAMYQEDKYFEKLANYRFIVKILFDQITEWIYQYLLLFDS